MEKDYFKLPEEEKEKYRRLAREKWSNEKLLSLFPGLNVTDNFIEGAASAFYDNEHS